MKSLNVLISGAGVGGPALAYWLHNYGHRVTIVERAPKLRDGGYAVDFRGNAIEVLRRMGILDEVRTAQTHTGTVYFVDGDGKQLAPMPSIFLSGELEILRGDLGKILYDLTKNTTKYIFDDSITAISETPDGTQVTFQHSKPQTFDVVVGADGTHSKVRELVFGNHSQFVRHLGYGVSIFTTKNYLKLDHSGVYFATPGKLAALYSSHDNTEAKASFYFAMPPNKSRPSGPKAQKEMIAELFADEKWEVPRLLKDMQRSEDFYFDTIDQVRMDTWHKGRVVLLGDAGYCASPLSGAGTGLAIIGAYILAGELTKQKDVATAFTSYQKAMRGYVKKAQSLPNLLGPLMVPKSRLVLSLRVGLLRTIAFMRLEKLIAKIARTPSDAVRLADYT